MQILKKLFVVLYIVCYKFTKNRGLLELENKKQKTLVVMNVFISMKQQNFIQNKNGWISFKIKKFNKWCVSSSILYIINISW